MTATEVATLGGHARALSLSPKRRKQIARLAALARWAKRAAHYSTTPKKGTPRG